MTSTLPRLLEMSSRLAEDLEDLFQASGNVADTRRIVTIGLCNAAMDHWSGQRLLIAAGHDAPAMALVRPHYEAVLRAIWMLHAAPEHWITNFAAPMPPEQVGEPVLGPPVDSMLEALDGKVPPFIVHSLRELKEVSWKPMNSFVHGGVRQVALGLGAGHTIRLEKVLLNANGLALLTANLFVIALGNPLLAGRVVSIQRAHLECLPPTSAPAQPGGATRQPPNQS